MRHWIKNLPIRFKVWLATAIVAVSFVVFAGTSYLFFSSEMKQTLFERALAMGDGLRLKIESQLDALAGDFSGAGGFSVDLAELIANYPDMMRGMILSPDGVILASNTPSNIEKKAASGLLSAIHNYDPESRQPVLYDEIFYTPIPLEHSEKGLVGYLVLGENYESYAEVMRNIMYVIIALAVITLGAALIALYWLVELQFREPIMSLVEDAGRISRGDLTRPSSIFSNDEIGQLGQAFESMRANLIGMVITISRLASSIGEAGKLSKTQADDVETRIVDQHEFLNVAAGSLENLNSTTLEINESVDSLSHLIGETSTSIMQMGQAIGEVERNVDSLVQVANDSSASIEEIAQSIRSVDSNLQQLADDADATATSINEINASIQSIEDREKDSTELSREVFQIAEEGVSSVERTYDGMKRINAAVMSTISIIDSLGHNSEEIGNILDVINQVAEETNLLALNAAIIAAQSGEHGRTFSVVSDEIRDLAERVASSTQEIASLIETVQDEISRAVESINAVKVTVNEGEQLSLNARGILERILTSSQHSQETIEAIAKATREQSRGTAELTQSINRMSGLIHQVARAINDQARGSSLIIEGVDRMKDVVSQVDSATKEQGVQVRLITEATEKIDQSTRRISDTAGLQKEQSQEITNSILTNLSITKENTTSILNLKSQIKTLSEAAEQLGQQALNFKVPEEQ